MTEDCLAWKKAYEIGIEEVDLQHQYFVKLINRLAVELAEELDDAYRNALIEELNAYARFHFISEENMMMRAEFPHLETHRQHHQQLLSTLANMEMELEMDVSAKNVNQILRFLIKWFLNHTAIEDRAFADFLGSHS